MSSLMSYAALAFAIVLEVEGTTFLGKSEHFTKLIPTLICAILYACSFYMLAQALRNIPLGIAYASWGGLSIILTAIVGMFFFKQKLDTAAISGIALIVIGVVVVNVFSKMSVH
ncbi:DMT family transporter [Pantoea septica]|uniref:DMT family transporter n=1 Tax=Pantoea septica TaxID=472695 RepID=UPI000534A166|nr:multidrug efflux SMR transporter [Pantoea septica]